MWPSFFTRSRSTLRAATSTAPAIQLDNIQLHYGERCVLDELNLHFSRQQLSVILGPNGTGKSSLLKVISAEQNYSGECAILGRAHQDWPSEQLAKHMGVLPQESHLSFNFSAKEVVELGGMGLSLSASDLQAVVTSNMQHADVQHLAERSYPSLSGGEKQRVHLARILTQLEQSAENKILLLDEPTAALDIAHQHSILGLLKRLADAGACVVMVLHDLNLAAQYADRILFLNQGKIVADARPKQALQAELIEAVYQHPVQVITHPTLGYPVVL